MKLYYFFFLIILFSAFNTQANEGFKYQAVARDQNGAILANQAIGLQISIIQDAINKSPVYVEEHQVTSNAYGLIQLEVGDGLPLQGNFSTLDWSKNSFMKIEMDVAGGTNYLDMGTSSLFPVPKALYAERAKSIANPFGLNVKDFGAKGDNIADDTQSFKDAVAAAAITGSKVFIPTGVYKITQSIAIPDGVTLVGEGTGNDPLQTPSNGSAIYFEGSKFAFKVTGHNAGIRDLVIVDKSSNQAKGGIKIIANGRLVESLRFHNLLISGFTNGTGLLLSAINSGGIAYSSFYNVRIRNAKIGIQIKEDASSFTNSNTFHHGAISGGGFNYGILINGGNNNVFYGTVVEPFTSAKGHLVVKKGEIQGFNIRIEGTNQPENIPVVEFFPDTKNSYIDGTYSGGLTLDKGNNFINFKSGKAIFYKNSSANQFKNPTFSGFDGNTIPDWQVVGTVNSVEVLTPELTNNHQVIKLEIPANTVVEFKPTATAMPTIHALPLYDQVNFGFYMKTATAGVAHLKTNPPSGLTISQKHPGDDEWHFIGMNGLVNRTQPLNAGVFINNSTGSVATVYISAPTLAFGNQVPTLDAKPLTTNGGTLTGALAYAMESTTTPTAGFLTLSKSANVFEVSGTSTISRINHLTADRFPKGTIITLLFNDSGTGVSNSPYINLISGYTSTTNSSLTLISLGNGTWREISRNL